MESQHGSADLWMTYEGNVQAYRGLALSAQGFFLAVGAILLDGDQLTSFAAVLCLAMVTTWWVYFPVVFARTAIVDFHKFDLGRSLDHSGRPAGPQTTRFLREKDYAHVTNWRLRSTAYASLTSLERAKPGRQQAPAFRTLRATRLKLDVVVPVMFTLTWIVFAVGAFQSDRSAEDPAPVRHPHPTAPSR